MSKERSQVMSEPWGLGIRLLAGGNQPPTQPDPVPEKAIQIHTPLPPEPHAGVVWGEGSCVSGATLSRSPLAISSPDPA